MSAAPALRRGWCPSLLQPMESGDGWLARVKPTAALLTAAQARTLAQAVARDGNGHLDLTSRAALQVRGLSEATLPRFADTVLALGLAVADPAAESRRSVLASPLAGDDPACFDVRPLASALEAALVAAIDLALPGKFGFLLDGGGLLPLGSESADIAFHALVPDRFALVLAGQPTEVSVPAAAVTASALALARAYLALARPPQRRMRDLLIDRGLGAVLAQADLSANAPAATPAKAPDLAAGYLPYPGGARGAFAAVAPFGRLTAAALQALAELAERHGDATLRPAPGRRLLLPGVAADTAAAVTAAARDAGFIVAADDPRLAVAACPGAPACRNATVAASADAATFAAALCAPRPGLLLHVSGCGKGCAHPTAAALTLTGRAGRYDLVREGRAGDAPLVTDLTLDAAIRELAAWSAHG